jgi:hypothetical protein
MTYNLYNNIKESNKKTDKHAVVFVIYEEFVKEDYDHVEIWIDKDVTIFKTGDVVKDFHDAVDYGVNLGVNVIYSSTVDSFLMDNDKWKYDDENYIVEV